METKINWKDKEEVKAYHRAKSKKWRRNNPDKIIAYNLKNADRIEASCQRWRDNHPNASIEYRKKNLEKKRKIDTLYNKKHPEIRKKWRDNNPKKMKAQALSAQIPRKPNCEICDSKEHLQKHHWRYDKPMLVNTLCRECHTVQHYKRTSLTI